MKTNSIWEMDLNSNYKTLENDMECDVLIIGGGLTGILTAFYLKDSNLKVVLVERNKLLSGITSKMTAKITPLQDILPKIEKEKLTLYLKSQLDGIKLLKNNIENFKISCDFKKNDSYLYTTKKNNIKKIKQLEPILKNLNIPFEKEELPIPKLNSIYSIKTNLSYEIHPIKYLKGILKEIKSINIYENTNIIKVLKEKKEFVCKTDNSYQIKSKKVIFATNYPYFLKPLFFPLKVRLERSRILSGKSNYIGSYNLINIDKKIESIRFYKDKMIYLFDNHYLSHFKVNSQKQFSNSFIEYPDYDWTNMDLITNDYLPIIGEVFQNMYIITGFNTWGLLSSHIGSSFISSMILKRNKYLKYKELYNPRKKINLKKTLNSSINIYESLNGYFKGMIRKNKLVYYNKESALYIGSDGTNYIVKRTCPHMKCKLLFNEIEQTWDCPCHGSRFDLKGNVISGPSKYGIKKM